MVRYDGEPFIVKIIILSVCFVLLDFADLVHDPGRKEVYVLLQVARYFSANLHRNRFGFNREKVTDK